MPTNIYTSTPLQGSHTFNLGLAFIIPGYTGTIYNDIAIPDTWEVRLVNPEGKLTVKTSGITFVDPAVPTIYVPIAAGDLDKAGTYYYQVSKTTGGGNIKSSVSSFIVEESVPSLTF